MFIVVLLVIAQIWTQPKCSSIDEWIKEMWCVCMCVMYIYTQWNLTQ